MNSGFFIEGLLIGLAVSVPLGPLGMLCIQRTVNKNWESGILSGLGISMADAIYAVIAGFSLSIIIDFIQKYEIYFKLIGLVVLIALGIHIFRSNPAKEIKKYKKRGNSYLQDFLTTFLITLSNPLAVFVFIAVFSSYSIVLQLSQLGHALLLIAGIFSGSALWWLILTGFANLFRHKLTISRLEFGNKMIGIGIIVLAVILFGYMHNKGL